MQDKTITNSLLALRKQIITRNLDGLSHVNALLVARGIDPAKVRAAAKRKPDFSRKGIMRLMVVEAMRGAPKTAREIAARRPEITPEAARKRTAQALDKMRLAGLVKRKGRLWGLVKTERRSEPFEGCYLR